MNAKFDTSPSALTSLHAANVPESVILAMVSGQRESRESALSRDESTHEKLVEEERRTLHEKCPGCLGIMIDQFDASTNKVTESWITKNQREYLKDHAEKIKKSGQPFHFSMVKNKENADFVIVWSSSIGERPYTTYVPQTATSRTSISGDINATSTTQTTTYQTQQSQWQYVNFIASIYDRSGAKVYEVLHQGNFRWSKPDKDCLEDAFKFLYSQLPPK